MFYVYVIKNDRDKIYIGQTANLEERMERHNGKLKNKKSSFTYKNKSGDWVLIYKEVFETRKMAMKRERELKSYQGRQWIKKQFYK